MGGLVNIRGFFFRRERCSSTQSGKLAAASTVSDDHRLINYRESVKKPIEAGAFAPRSSIGAQHGHLVKREVLELLHNHSAGRVCGWSAPSGSRGPRLGLL